MLFDICAGTWDPELLELFGVPSARCRRGSQLRRDRRSPARRRSTATRFRWPASRATSRRRSSGRPASIPAWARTPTAPARSCSRTPAPAAAAGPGAARDRRVADRASDSTYALEAAIFVTGAAVQWLRDGLGDHRRRGRDRAPRRARSRQRGRLLRPGADRPRLTPLGPLRAGHDRGAYARLDPRPPGPRGARGDRLPDASTRSAAVEAASGRSSNELRADGGATANDWLMQFQADSSGSPCWSRRSRETTALGAAYLAGVGVRPWTIDQLGSTLA